MLEFKKMYLGRSKPKCNVLFLISAFFMVSLRKNDLETTVRLITLQSDYQILFRIRDYA